jgi:hypothetical protein
VFDLGLLLITCFLLTSSNLNFVFRLIRGHL